jgi:O-antigen ligase
MIIPVIKGMIFHAGFGFTHQTAYQMPRPFFTDHTIYGACLAFVLPMLVILALGYRTFSLSRLHCFLLLSLTVFLGVAEFLSYSRAAWLSLAGALFLGILLQRRISARQLGMLLACGAMLLWFFSGQIVSSLGDKTAVSSKGDLEQHVRSITNVETDASNKERINRWKCAIRMGEERPLLGFGPRTYKFMYGQYQVREDMTYTSTYNGNKGHAHSEYLSWYAESGLPGLLLHGGLFLFTLLFGADVVRKCRDRKNRLVATGALLGFFTYFIHGFFNSFMEDDKIAALVLSSMAILVFIAEKEKRLQTAQ